MSMACIIQPNGKSYLVYYDGVKAHGLAHPDELNAINMVACIPGLLQLIP